VVVKNSVFWDTAPCSLFNATDISEEHVAFIFRAEEQAKEETDVKQIASRGTFYKFICFVCIGTRRNK
jgi:hypothetical protein